MSVQLIQRLIEAGTPVGLIAEVAMELAKAQAIMESVEKKREKDRERKKRNSVESVEFQESPLPPPDRFSDFPLTPPLTPPISEDKSSSIGSAPKKFKLPDWVPEEDWGDFCQYRGRGFTGRAKQLILADLESLSKSGNDPGEVLRQSVKRGWTGVFKVNQERNYGRKPSKIDDIREIVARNSGGAISGSEEPWPSLGNLSDIR